MANNINPDVHTSKEYRGITGLYVYDFRLQITKARINLPNDMHIPFFIGEEQDIPFFIGEEQDIQQEFERIIDLAYVEGALQDG